MNNLQFRKTTPSNPKYLLNEIKNTHTHTKETRDGWNEEVEEEVEK